MVWRKARPFGAPMEAADASARLRSPRHGARTSQQLRYARCMALLPCTHCRRHVDASASACPFCGEALALVAPAPRLVHERLRRSAVVALGASAILVGCSSGDTADAPPYGNAPYDSAVDTSADTGADASKDTTTDAAADTGSPDTGDAAADTRETGVAPPYGIPPSDGG